MFVVVLIALGGIGTFAIWRLSRPRAPRLVAGATPSITRIGRDGFWIGPHTMSVGDAAPVPLHGRLALRRSHLPHRGRGPPGLHLHGDGADRRADPRARGVAARVERRAERRRQRHRMVRRRRRRRRHGVHHARPDDGIAKASAATSGTSGSSCSSAGDTASASSGSSCSSAGRSARVLIDARRGVRHRRALGGAHAARVRGARRDGRRRDAAGRRCSGAGDRRRLPRGWCAPARGRAVRSSSRRAPPPASRSSRSAAPARRAAKRTATTPRGASSRAPPAAISTAAARCRRSRARTSTRARPSGSPLRSPAARSIGDAVAAAARARWSRAVRVAELDVRAGDALRVATVVTTLQQGGAERLAIDLAVGMRDRARTLLVALARDRAARVRGTARHARARAATARRARRAGARGGRRIRRGRRARASDPRRRRSRDRRRRAGGRHRAQQPPGWPADLLDLAPAAFVACAGAVADELRAAGTTAPIRVIRNATDPARALSGAARAAARRALRAELGFGDDDVVLLAVANPRPQKRLERLPAVARAAAARVAPRAVRLVVAGAAASTSAGSLDAAAALRAEIARTRDRRAAARLGRRHRRAVRGERRARRDERVGGAQHRAARGDRGGRAGGRHRRGRHARGRRRVDRARRSRRARRRVRRRDRRVRARSATEGRAVRRSSRSPRRCGVTRGCCRARRHRSRTAGACGSSRTTSRWAARSRARGACSPACTRSACRARAAVVQERAASPTRGTRTLAAAGVRVLVAPPDDAVRAVAAIADAIDDDPPETVLFWNLIAEHKLRLADALIGARVFDVSPGEMFFDALDRYFERPRADLPIRTPRDYGALLAGVIVKYAAEVPRAAALGAPVHVVPNGVPIPELASARSPREPIVIGTAARISPQKRLEQLIDAVRLAAPRLPPFVLRVAGRVELGQDGYADELRRARRRPADRVARRGRSTCRRFLPRSTCSPRSPSRRAVRTRRSKRWRTRGRSSRPTSAAPPSRSRTARPAGSSRAETPGRSPRRSSRSRAIPSERTRWAMPRGCARWSGSTSRG